MKEWKKPLVKVVIVEEDVIATSVGVSGQALNIDDAGYVDQSQPTDGESIWGRTN